MPDAGGRWGIVISAYVGSPSYGREFEEGCFRDIRPPPLNTLLHGKRRLLCSCFYHDDANSGLVIG